MISTAVGDCENLRDRTQTYCFLVEGENILESLRVQSGYIYNPSYADGVFRETLVPALETPTQLLNR